MIQVDPTTAFMADDIETLRDATLNGLGIAWLPHWLLAPHLEDGSLLPVMADRPALAIDTYLARPHAPPPRRVQVAANMLASEFERHLPR